MTQAQQTIYAASTPIPPTNLASAVPASLLTIPTEEETNLTPRQNTLAAMEARGLRGGQAALAAGLSYQEARETRRLPQFQQAVAKILSAVSLESVAGAVAYRTGRIQSISERYAALRSIIEQRSQACDPRYLNPNPVFIYEELNLDPYALKAQFPELGSLYDPTNPACHMCDPDAFLVPGTETGMYAKSYKIIGAGANAQQIIEWTFDAALANELRKLEEAAAVETGQNKQADVTAKMYINIDMARI